MPILEDRSDQCWQLSHTAMTAPITFPVRAPTTQAPCLVTAGVVNQGDGVFAQGSGVGLNATPGLVAPVRAIIIPFGSGGSGSTLSMNVLGWRATGGSNLGLSTGAANAKTWIPILIGTYNITLGNIQGAPGGDIPGTYNFAGTITQTFGVTTTSSNLVWDQFVLSPGITGIGMVAVRIMGFQFTEVTFQLGSGGATAVNSLIGRW